MGLGLELELVESRLLDLLQTLEERPWVRLILIASRSQLTLAMAHGPSEAESTKRR
jgi:hypothetical protein